MDIQQNITEAIEHLTVIEQVTAISHLIQKVASELVATRTPGKGGPVWESQAGVPAMPSISPLKCRVSVHIPTRRRDCWRSC